MPALIRIIVCFVFLLTGLCGYAQKGGKIRSEQGTLQVFPNPTTGKFTVQVKEQESAFHINVYNLIGEMVFHWESGQNTSANFEIDLARRPDGVYFVELDTDQANQVRRIILNRN